MGKMCAMCGVVTGFFYWTSGRNFPKTKLSKLVPNCTANSVVCYYCAKNKLDYPEDK